MKKYLRFMLLLILAVALASAGCLGKDQNNEPGTTPRVIVVVIDGLRYSESLGDSERIYIPNIDDLAQSGTYCDQFYNDSLTYTSRAIPALWCGSWTDIQDTLYQGSETQYTLKPTIFEYYRKQKSVAPENCQYVLKYVESLWLPSFHDEYGPDYWPGFVSQGESDIEVMQQAISLLALRKPSFLWIYLADVDTAGHTGDWETYTDAIVTADSLVGSLWEYVQLQPDYSGNTILFLTNDHGRHDDEHGGFSGHGDDCSGCRRIMLLAIGPIIRENAIIYQYHRIPDLAVTIAEILGIYPAYGTGEVIGELFESSD